MKTEVYKKTLDELKTDLLVTTLSESDRPPRGVSGLVDWRMNGFLSKMIIKGAIHGAEEECVLMPLHRRLPARRLLIVGTGPREKFTLSRARALGEALSKRIAKLGAIDVAVSIPPAVDEQQRGETARVVQGSMAKTALPEDFFLHWIDPETVDLSSL